MATYLRTEAGLYVLGRPQRLKGTIKLRTYPKGAKEPVLAGGVQRQTKTDAGKDIKFKTDLARIQATWIRVVDGVVACVDVVGSWPDGSCWVKRPKVGS